MNGYPASDSSNGAWSTYINSVVAKFVSIVQIPDAVRYTTPNLTDRCVEDLILNRYVNAFTHSHLDIPLNSPPDSRLATYSAQIRRSVELSWTIVRFLIETTAPDLIYVFNGRNPESWPIFRYSLKAQIECLFHERGSTISRYELFCKPPAYVSSWQQNIAKLNNYPQSRQDEIAAAVFYSRQRRGKVYNFSYAKRNLNENQSTIERLPRDFVLFLTSSNFEYYSIPDPDCWNDLGNQERAACTLLAVCEELGLPLVIRQHPNSGNYDQQQFTDLALRPSCFIFSAQDDISSYHLAEHAKVCFTVGSTITYELLNKRIRCALLSNSIGRGHLGIYELRSKEEIRDFIVSPHKYPVDTFFSTKFGKFMSTFGVDFSFFNPDSQFSGTFDVDLLDEL